MGVGGCEWVGGCEVHGQCVRACVRGLVGVGTGGEGGLSVGGWVGERAGGVEAQVSSGCGWVGWWVGA